MFYLIDLFIFCFFAVADDDAEDDLVAPFIFYSSISNEFYVPFERSTSTKKKTKKKKNGTHTHHPQTVFTCFSNISFTPSLD